jgi:hypothetical protein
VSEFRVETSDLHSLVTVMRNLLQELSAAGGSAPAAGGLECPRVEDHLHSFFSDWSEGLDKVQSNFSALADRLAAAGQGYEGVDGSIVSALGGR